MTTSHDQSNVFRDALAAAREALATFPGNLDAARVLIQARTNLSREDAVRVALAVESAKSGASGPSGASELGTVVAEPEAEPEAKPEATAQEERPQAHRRASGSGKGRPRP